MSLNSSTVKWSGVGHERSQLRVLALAIRPRIAPAMGFLDCARRRPDVCRPRSSRANLIAVEEDWAWSLMTESLPVPNQLLTNSPRIRSACRHAPRDGDAIAGSAFARRCSPIAARSGMCSAWPPAERMASASQSEPRDLSTIPPW